MNSFSLSYSTGLPAWPGKGAALATPSAAKLDMVSSDFNELRDAFGYRTYVWVCFGFFWWLSFGDFISINTHLQTHTHTYIFIWVSRSQFGASEEVEEEAANKKATWPARSKRFTHFFLARSFSCTSYSLALSLSRSSRDSTDFAELRTIANAAERPRSVLYLEDCGRVSNARAVWPLHKQLTFFFQVPVIVPVCVCLCVSASVWI